MKRKILIALSFTLFGVIQVNAQIATALSVTVTQDPCSSTSAALIKMEDFKVFSNSAEGKVNISATFLESSSNTLISVYDLAGRVIFESKENISPGKFNKTIDMSNFNQGSYITRITSGEKQFNQVFIY